MLDLTRQCFATRFVLFDATISPNICYVSTILLITSYNALSINVTCIPSSYDWSKRLEGRWFSDEGIARLHPHVRASLPYDPHPFQLQWTARILYGQDVLCLSATEMGNPHSCTFPRLRGRARSRWWFARRTFWKVI